MANENDIFQGDILEAGEDITAFLDENDEMFSLLGMSEEEKEKAAMNLKEEDMQYSNASVSEENRLDDMLSQADQMNAGDVSEQDSLQDMLDMMESDGVEDVAEQTEQVNLEDILRQADIGDMLNEAEQMDSEDMPGQGEQMDLGDMSVQTEQADLGDMLNESEQVDFEDLLNQTGEVDLEDVLGQVDLKGDEQMDSFDDTGDTVPDSGAAEDDNLDEAVRALIQDMDNGTSELDIDSDELANLDSLDISDEVMEGIDFNEDLTNSSGDSMPETGEPLGEETNFLKKKEEKAQRKEEKRQAKEEKRKAKEEKKKAKKLAKGVAEEEIEETADTAIDEINLDQILSEGEEKPADTGISKEAMKNLSFGEKLSLVLFGPDEEEELSAKEIARLEEKQAAKEKKKEEKAQKKADAQQEKAHKKAQAKEMAVVKKAAAQDKKEQIRQQEEEEDAKEKKFTSKQVGLVAVILALLACTVVLGTNQFNYHMVIARATNYFEMQKYRKAYEQIVGVDVKDRDQQIRDKIYCVMYVQQQVDSYRNFCKLEMYDSGLDSLVKGVRKYNKHYDEAKELGIEADLDRLHAVIENELTNQYGLTMSVVEEWLALDQTTYTQAIRDYVAAMQFQ